MTATPQAAPPALRRIGWRAAPRPAGIAAAVLLVGAAVAVCASLGSILPPASLSLLFLVVVLIAAVGFGFWTGLVAATLAFLAFNFFFVDPVLTFRVGRAEDVVALAVFVLVAGLTGLLAGRLREEADAARERASMLERLSALVSELGTAADVGAIEAAVARHLARIAGASAVILRPRGDRLEIVAAAPGPVELVAADRQAAERAWRRGAAERAAAAGWDGSAFTFRPIVADGHVVAVSGVGRPPPGRHAPRDRERAVAAVLGQAQVAIEGASAAEQAAAARAAAEREALRAALLSSLSHDLRTPLATILGAVTSLRELADTLPAEARADLLAAIEEEAARLSRYVTNLLHMTRLQAGLEPSLDWVDPADVAHGAVERARRSFPERSIALAAVDPLPLLRSDAALLDQVLFNLVENAVKFSSADAPVEVAVTASGDGVRFSVTDAGPGIADAERARIFDAFVRGADAGAPGTGLGLAICRGIVRTLGGAIDVVSPVAAGRGSTFRVDLPPGRRAAP